MKYYESTFDEYINSVTKINIHDELETTIKSFPDNIYNFENLIIYGPAGTGKYSQCLQIIKKYNPPYDKSGYYIYFPKKPNDLTSIETIRFYILINNFYKDN